MSSSTTHRPALLQALDGRSLPAGTLAARLRLPVAVVQAELDAMLQEGLVTVTRRLFTLSARMPDAPEPKSKRRSIDPASESQRKEREALRLQRDVLRQVQERRDQTARDVALALSLRQSVVETALDALDQQGHVQRFGGRIRTVPSRRPGLEVYAQPLPPVARNERLLGKIVDLVRDDYPEGASVADVAMTLKLPSRDARDLLVTLVGECRLTCRAGRYLAPRKHREERESKRNEALAQLLGALGVVTR